MFSLTVMPGNNRTDWNVRATPFLANQDSERPDALSAPIATPPACGR